MDQNKNDSSNRDSARTLAELGDIVAFVGHEVQFSGTLTYKGNVRIDGTFEGEIETDDTLFIGEQANVRAQIRAGSVIASGRITGDITAQQRVELKSPAIIDASISTPKLSMDNGVIFNGKISMGPNRGQGKSKNNVSPVIKSKEPLMTTEDSSDSVTSDDVALEEQEGATLTEQS
ncbi:MAG: polymer-forming cytoskeletal protein [Nitrospirae bacterium]|nr:polymer-forming cytoskeletal protein [Nitrospirota bacterium]MDA1303008.1 polymer-forming cytoskeletal protein [Nitrospirota bacterium]